MRCSDIFNKNKNCICHDHHPSWVSWIWTENTQKYKLYWISFMQKILINFIPSDTIVLSRKMFSDWFWDVCEPNRWVELSEIKIKLKFSSIYCKISLKKSKIYFSLCTLHKHTTNKSKWQQILSFFLVSGEIENDYCMKVRNFRFNLYNYGRENVVGYKSGEIETEVVAISQFFIVHQTFFCTFALVKNL